MYNVLILTNDANFYKEVEKKISGINRIKFHTFDHGLELINFFLTNYAQLVILDIDVLQNEILEMIQVLRTIHKETKILLLLSPVNMPLCSNALTLGISSYQIKPISQENVIELITTLLNTSLTHH